MMTRRVVAPLIYLSLLLAGCSIGESDQSAGEPTADATADTVELEDTTIAEDAATPDVTLDTTVEDTEEPQCPEPGSTARPNGRSEVFGVMDPIRRQLVFFGGDDGAPVNCNPAPHPIGGTWIYDTVCATFEEIVAFHGPGPRARGMSIYDPVNDRMVIFGGRYREASSGPYTLYNEVWALNLESFVWTKIETSGPQPAPRFNPAGGYNALTGEMIVFGGTKSTSGTAYDPLADTWALNLETNTWRIIESTNNPEPRVLHTATVDSENNRLFVYGGTASFFASFFGDLWSLDLESGQWEEIHTGWPGAPMGRIWSTITWDKVGQRMLLFGGHDSGSVGNNNDTWEFDPSTNTWLNLVLPETIDQPAIDFCNFPPDFTFPNMEAPDRRSAQLAALDETRGEWVIFGGKTDCGLIDDVWVYTLEQDAWIRLIDATMGESCIRGDNPQFCLAMCN